MSQRTMEAHYRPNWNLTQAHGLTGYNCGYAASPGCESFDEHQRSLVWRLLGDTTIDGEATVLDVGCGIGGAARFIAAEIGCRVTGIDLTPEYIAAAKSLTERTGLAGLARFELASALDMPFADAAFDAAITFHVAMNIKDRPALYGEIARVLKPGATLCIYDVMTTDGESPDFPVPWAQSAETSHLTTPDETQTLLAGAGFEIRDVYDLTDSALDLFRQTAAAAAADGSPPLGNHILMGADAPVKNRNVKAAIEGGRIAPVQMIASLT